MKKIGMIFAFLSIVSVLCFANDADANVELENVVNEARTQTDSIQTKKDADKSAKYQEYAKKKRSAHGPEAKVIRNIGLIVGSTPLLTFGGWFIGFSSYLFSISDENNELYHPASRWGAPTCIVAGMSLITLGLSLLLVGAIHLPRVYKDSDKTELYRRLQKLDKDLENLVIVSGVFSGTGLVSLGTGIGLMCYGHSVQKIIEYGTGVALTVVGTIFSFAFVPIFASSLSIFCMNKKSLVRLTPDVAITHDDKQGLDSGYGVSLGLRISL